MGMTAGNKWEIFHEKHLSQSFNPSCKNLSHGTKQATEKKEERKEGGEGRLKNTAPFLTE